MLSSEMWSGSNFSSAATLSLLTAGNVIVSARHIHHIWHSWTHVTGDNPWSTSTLQLRQSLSSSGSTKSSSHDSSSRASFQSILSNSLKPHMNRKVSLKYVGRSFMFEDHVPLHFVLAQWYQRSNRWVYSTAVCYWDEGLVLGASMSNVVMIFLMQKFETVRRDKLRFLRMPVMVDIFLVFFPKRKRYKPRLRMTVAKKSLPISSPHWKTVILKYPRSINRVDLPEKLCFCDSFWLNKARMMSSK